jgi:hypothetical protein
MDGGGWGILRRRRKGPRLHVGAHHPDDATWTWSRPPAHLMSAVPVRARPTDVGCGGLAKSVRAPNVRRLDMCPCPVCLALLLRRLNLTNDGQSTR